MKKNYFVLFVLFFLTFIGCSSDPMDMNVESFGTKGPGGFFERF